VGDLAEEVAKDADVRIIVPHIPGSKTHDIYRGVPVTRFRYFPARWEDVADGALLENVRTQPSRLLQVIPLFIGEWVAVQKTLLSWHPEMIHAHWIIPQGMVAWMSLTRIPILLTTLGGDLYALDRFPFRYVMRRVVRRARQVTVMNSDMKARVVSLGAHPENVSVIPMGANLDGIVRRVPNHERTVRLLFVGRLVPKKGLSYLIEALRSLPQGLSWSLSIVGDGPLRESLEKCAQGLPIRFVGAQNRDQLRRSYKNSDVLVTPSVPAESGDQDGLPVAMLEAMCAGLPVVASRLPGIDEVVEDSINGFLVEPANPAAIRDALALLIRDPELLERLGKNARNVADQHSSAETGRRYRALIAGMLHE
jgi:glycosyltransferase involved in cell wall biosynthesis